MPLSIGMISLFPDMFNALEHGITGRAIRDQRLALHHFNPRDYTTDPHRTVDDRPYGGGPGMVMRFEPCYAAIKQAKHKLSEAPVIHLSPQGQPLDQTLVKSLAESPELILFCSRYEGVDQRLINQTVDLEVSVGDYVVSGGELPAMMLIDALTRLIPGALGHPDSADQDSFSNGLLDCPHFTRPPEIAGESVPNVLLSGNHEQIQRWRLKQALGNTWQKRPDLLNIHPLTELEQQLLEEFKNEHSKPGG